MADSLNPTILSVFQSKLNSNASGGITVFKATAVNLLAIGQTELIPVLAGKSFMPLQMLVVLKTYTGSIVLQPVIRVGNTGTYNNLASDYVTALTTINDPEAIPFNTPIVSVGTTAISFSVKTAGTGASALTADVYAIGLII